MLVCVMKNALLTSFTILGITQAHAALTVVESSTNVGPGTTITDNVSTFFIDGFIDIDTSGFRVNEAFPSSPPSQLNASFASFGETRIFFRASEASLVPDPFLTRPDTAPTDSSMFIAITDATFHQLDRINTTAGFINGAQSGDDNWVYFSNNNNPGTESPSFWTQFNITETSATPIRYVHDPANPFGDIVFADALAAPEPSSSMLIGLSFIALIFRRQL